MMPDDPELYEGPIKAYHMIFGGKAALDRVLDEGAILPLAYRADPDQIKKHCQEYVSSLRSDRFGREALHAVLDEELSKMTRRPGWTPEGTFLWCTDIVAGDAWNVFLAPFDWTWGTEDGVTGLVFDAEKLISLGARYRPHDFMYIWEDAIALRSKAKSTRDAEESLRESLKEARKTAKKIEASGEAAILGLETARQWLASGQGYPETDAGELVWRGPLPVELATEIWLYGEPVKISRAK
jgi:hypothetical protein